MRKDKLTIKAKSEGLRARSAYKLFQMNDRFKIIRKGDSVLDLGCWPGGWLIAAKKLGASKLVGIDLTQIEPIEGVEFHKGDAVEISKSLNENFDVVLSDMAPKTTGIIHLDVDRSLGLAEMAMEIAIEKLKPKGNFLVKVFQGWGFNEFVAELRKHFSMVKIAKPEASKMRSKELYVVAMKLKSA